MSALESVGIDQMPALSLEDRRDTLAHRLNTGFDTIERANQQGRDTTHWEAAWIRLLAEYEEICDQIARRPLSRTY